MRAATVRDRDARQPVAGEDGAAAHARRRGAGREDRAVRRPEPLPEARTAAWPRNSARSAATSSTTPRTARRTTRPPAPRSGTRRSGRIDAFTCATGTGGTLGGVSRYLKEQKPGGAHRARRPDGQRALQLGQDWRTEVVRFERRHRGHRHRPRHRQFEGAPIDDAVQIEDPEIVRTSTGCCARRASSSAAPAAPTSRPRCVSRATSGPGTRS